MQTENRKEMEQGDEALRGLLRESIPAPVLPPRFQDLVWRRIEAEGLRGNAVTLVELVDRLMLQWLRPRVAVAWLSALIVLSGSVGIWRGAENARHSAQERYLATVAPLAIR